MTTTWLIIANSEKAIVYDISKKNQLATLIHNLIHPESRMKEHELAGDQPSQFYASGATHSSHAEKETPHQPEYEHCAKALSQFLERELGDNQFTNLIITAEPPFQGLLMKELTKNVEKTVKKVIHKNYVTLPKKELQDIVEKIKNDFSEDDSQF